MEFGIFNLMGAREADKPTAQVFSEVADQTRLADELGYTIAWFAEHHFSNYCRCASPLMMVAHCASITRRIRLGTAVVVLSLYNPARLAAEIATADALSNGRLMLGVGAGYQPYEFERFSADIAKNLEMTEEFCDILDLAFSRDFFRYEGKHYRMPDTHIPARPVQNPLPIYVAGHTPAMFRTAARRGYRVLSSGRVGGPKFLAEQYADIVAAFAAENAPLSRAHVTINRFAHITDSREEGMRFAENARYQTRLASSLRRRQEVMQGTMLVDVPFPDEPPLETIHDDLLIGDVDTVAGQRPRAGHPVRRLRSAAAVVDEAKPRCARLEGFSLHANVAVPAHARERLEHVCRYVLRPPLALERLSESSHGQLLYELAHPRADGSTHVVLDPLELLEKLAVLVPAPRTYLLRYHGVLAPAAAWRSLIVPRPVEDGGGQASAGVMGEPAGELSSSAAGPARPARPDWAALLNRVFALDVLHCPRCGGRRGIVAVHTRPETLRPLLARLGLDAPAASRRASRSPPAWAD